MNCPRATTEPSCFAWRPPFPLLPDALGKMGINMLPITPERLANPDPFKQVTEMVGSGPFRFLPEERLVGARVAYRRFEKYRPREQGVPDWTAGPKIAQFDKIVWNVIPDGATAASAMQKGEADWWEQPVFDLLPLLARSPELATSIVEVTGNIGLLRMNQLFPPFDNPAIRRAFLGALDPAEFMAAVVGADAKASRDHVGVFAPDTPMASEASLSAITGPRDVAKAKLEIEKAGYRDEPVVIMTPTDYPRIDALADVAADTMRRCGLNVELQAADWGSVIRRRTSKAPVAEGGWSVFITTFTGIDMSTPASHLALRGNGPDSWFGWPVAPELERLRDQWLSAQSLAEQKAIAAKIQEQAFIDVPFLPLGQFFQPTVQRKELQGTLKGMTLFWNVRRA